MITYLRLKELVDYDPDTGVFTNKVKRGGLGIGDTIGNLHHLGYINICLDGETYPAHRLAWLYCFHEWPEKYLDHTDRNRSNNSIDNLREASREENGANMSIRKDNTTGYKGVTYVKARNKYMARLTYNKVVYFIGEFTEAKLAHEARELKAKELQKEFYNENSSNR